MAITKEDQDVVFSPRGWGLRSVLDAIPHLETNVRGFITDKRCETKEAPKQNAKPILREEDLPDWMTVDEAVEFLRMNRKTLYDQIISKKVSGVRYIGKRNIRLEKKIFLESYGEKKI